MGDVIDINDIRDDFSERVTNREYHGKARKKRSRAADPIKTSADVRRVRDYILNEKKYRNEDMRKRDYLLFSLGVTVGLRAGDLRELKVGDVLDDHGKLLHSIYLTEEKTDKNREIVLSDMALDALRFYLKDRDLDYESPLFGNLSRNNSEKYIKTISQKPESEYGYKRKTGTKEGLRVDSISRILKQIVKEAGVDVHGSSHMLRKTFAYRVAASYDDWTRGMGMAQKLLNHSNQGMTQRYLGYEGEEMREVYRNLNYDDDAEEITEPRVVTACQ